MPDREPRVDVRRPLPAAIAAIARGGEPLWVASLAALFVLWGYAWIPRAIRMLGRAGQAETVEWGVYMSLLVGFPLTTLIIALVLPRLFGRQAQTIVKASAVIFALWIAFLFALDGRVTLVLLALIPALGTALVDVGPRVLMRDGTPDSRVRFAMTVIVSLIAWMCAGSLVYWTRGSDWFLGSLAAIIALAVATGIAVWGLPRSDLPTEVRGQAGRIERVLSLVAIGLLVAFSFRTNPMVELYHWGFWTGPVEQLRQGGWLLNDTPSQYGFLSILIPTALPGSAWQSFWFFQAAIYAVVAATMFVVFRRMRPGIGNLVLSATLIFTSLFFRPRTASLILPAQMTPSGGPVRFVWCFVLLVYLLWAYDAHQKGKVRPGRAGFPVMGHAIWLSAVAWSFEAAIYCSAIWFSAFLVYLIQKAASERSAGMKARSIARRVVISAAIPLLMALVLYGIVWTIYQATIGVAPDMTAYVEYGMLYSRGFGALPIDPTGAVWYMLLVFFIVSTIGVALLVTDWRDFRLVVAAGVWGGVWSLGSYFVSRSHPVNLLSIVPVLVFAVAILLIVARDMPPARWHAYVRAAMIPAVAMPIALTLGHPGLVANLRSQQLSPARFTEQVPLMDAELESLMREAGAKPSDPVVRIADGRLVLPAWRSATGGAHIMSDRSWLPKPYEIIGTLSPERRQVYIDRDSRTPLAGWMIQHESDTVRWFAQHLEQIMRTHEPARKLERGPWRLWWMVPRKP